MKNLLALLISVAGIITSCVPTRDSGRNNAFYREGLSPDGYVPSSVSPRAEARYSTVYGGLPGYRTTSAEDGLSNEVQVAGANEEAELNGEECKVYRVTPNEDISPGNAPRVTAPQTTPTEPMNTL